MVNTNAKNKVPSIYYYSSSAYFFKDITFLFKY